jgi:predicted O-methyltransferase YrrM
MLPGQDELRTAIQHHQSGRLAEARAVYERVLAVQPNHPDALHLLGALVYQQGDSARAVELIGQAVTARPGVADFHANFALALMARARFAEAERHLERALALNPRHAKAGTDLRTLRTEPFFGAFQAYQGWHAPARQVFMSAAIDLLAAPLATDGGRVLRVIEIGSYMGGSCLTWAHALNSFAGGRGQVVCLDSWGAVDAGYHEGMAAALESDLALAIFRHNARFAPSGITVNAMVGRSGDVMALLADQSFDLVYIDGSHLYEDVRLDIRHARRLVRPGGIICGDDLELQEGECAPGHAEAHRQSDFVPDPLTGRDYHPGVTGAVAAEIGRVSAYDGFWIMRRDGGGLVPVDLKPRRGLVPPHWPEEARQRLEARFATSGELAGLVAAAPPGR